MRDVDFNILKLWPHFWRNAEAAEYIYLRKSTGTGNPIAGGRTLLERFGQRLEKVGPIGCREEFVDCKIIAYV
ncbi:uncharacterized protein N7529_005401 [Penicillium soppii]|uniref:uncharacterized protein n=1 Tax=Penicillium soppii TaxID=69789 RepID=UPI002549968C|nr:uncharacterized protein N7529_005401 [Penicillium soppii]KAJ5873048.1 hypothetical protein N7529_005401 [Penicillium soppii]